MSKTFNRHQNEIALAKAKRIVRRNWHISDPSLLDKISHRIKNNRKPCSCRMCGNPRKIYRGKAALTIQETKAKQTNDYEHN